ncbi:MAG TPA: CaiB/BaiF CoA-transferase family protein [Acidimicrobiales bacterium]|nr:CaiB/BaiF CoA-transferase family protein [Acidimicrobiales bacterium]
MATTRRSEAAEAAGPQNVDAGSDATGMPSAVSDAPLEGLRVVDFTHLVAGPFCTMMLADAGATVVKIEPPWGDSSRLRGARRDGPDGRHVSGYVVATNRGKKAIVLDLKTDRGREVALRLIERADVVTENFAPGVLDRIGLGLEHLRRLNPRLITVSISLLGSQGSTMPERAGLAIVAEAESGLASRVLDETGRPVPFGFPLGDIASGLTAYGGILTALLARGVNGVGRHIDVSMVRTLFAFNATAVAGYALAGESERAITTAPYGYFDSADGHVAIAVNVDNLWVKFCGAIGRPELAVDPRYSHYSQRDPRVAEVGKIVTAWTQTRSSKEIVDVLATAGVPCGRINTIGEIVDDPAYREAGLFTSVMDGMGGMVDIPRNLLGYVRPSARIPQMGEHTVEVLRDLGCSDREIEDLLAGGALGDDAGQVRAQLRPLRGDGGTPAGA